MYELTQHLFEMDSENEYVLFMNDPHFSEFESPNERVTKVLVNAPHYSWEEQVKFCRLLVGAKLDLMHFTHFNAPVLYRRPSVVTIHDLTLSFFPGKKMTSPFYRAAYHLVLSSIVKRSKGVIAVSENTKKDLVELLKVDPEKVAVIYEGVAEEFKIDPTIKKEEILLYTGVWRSHKNLVNLLEAFAQLCERRDFKGKLVITGREDPHYPEVKQAVHSLGLENRVVLPGLVPEDELVRLYNAAKVYVLPSLYEGFGLSPLESMACGTPVVTSNTSCLPEICGQDNARFFDPRDPEDMAQTIADVWFDETVQSTLCENGLQRVNNFSWKAMAEETLNLYNRVTHGKN